MDATEDFQVNGDANFCCGHSKTCCSQSCHALCCWTCGGCCWYVEQRTQLQIRYSITPTFWKNFCLFCFPICMPFLLSQQYLETKKHGAFREATALQAPDNPYPRVAFHHHEPSCGDCFFPIFGKHAEILPRWKLPTHHCTGFFLGNSHCLATRCCCTGGSKPDQ